jgi:hypothetical protein
MQRMYDNLALALGIVASLGCAPHKMTGAAKAIGA